MPVTFADYPEHFQYSGSEADGDEDIGMELKEFEEPKPDLPAGWARQRGDRWTENPQHAAAATGWSRLVRVCVSSSTEE